jgi:hypothetical protein
VTLPDDFPHLLAEMLAKEVHPFRQERLPTETAAQLVRERYGTESWLRKR